MAASPTFIRTLLSTLFPLFGLSTQRSETLQETSPKYKHHFQRSSNPAFRGGSYPATVSEATILPPPLLHDKCTSVSEAAQYCRPSSCTMVCFIPQRIFTSFLETDSSILLSEASLILPSEAAQSCRPSLPLLSYDSVLHPSRSSLLPCGCRA